MNTITTPGNTRHGATLLGRSQNVSRTLSNIDLRDLVNTARAQAGESRVRNDQFIIRVQDELGGELGVCKLIAHHQRGVDTSDNGQSKFTPKGVTWVAGLWALYQLRGVVK